MCNLYRNVLILFSLAFTSFSSLHSQIQYPELILDNDGFEVPSYFEVTFTDEIINLDSYTIYKILDNTGLYGPSGNLLHDFSVYDTAVENFHATQGYLIQFDDNTSMVIASLQSDVNENDKLIAYYKLTDGGNYAETLAASVDFPFDYRNDYDYDVDYENWAYYLIDDSESFLYGADRLEGTLLNVIHSPANNYYHYQLGVGTTDEEFEVGGSGWCYLEGSLVINSNDGDIVTNVTSSGGFDHVLVPDFSDLVLRSYTITDGQGIVTTEDVFKVVPAACPGDFNRDGAISSADLSFILGDFGCFVNCPTDLTNDGAVLINDISLFLGVYGVSCTGN